MAQTTCPAPSLFSALSTFGDSRSYCLVPGGDFETGAGGLAKSALRLPAGATAASPTFCVDLDAPTYRLFASQVAAVAGAKLSIDMIYADQSGQTSESTTLAGQPPSWSLVYDVALPSARLDQAGGTRQMRLRFRATSGAWRIDDVLRDPRMRS